MIVACYITTLALQFGAIHPSSSAHADSVGQLSVTCTDAPGTPIRYSLSLSGGLAGAFTPRRMRSGGEAGLKYNLYVDAARSLVWGDGNGGTVNVVGDHRMVGSTVTKHYPVYGRIFAGQNVPAGVYGDSILISLDF
jgi:spore coat protein U-like protein